MNEHAGCQPSTLYRRFKWAKPANLQWFISLLQFYSENTVYNFRPERVDELLKW